MKKFRAETFTWVTATGLYDARHGNRSTALIYILNRTGTRVPGKLPGRGYPGNELQDNGSPSILVQRERIATTVTRNFPILAARPNIVGPIYYIWHVIYSSMT